MAVEVPASATTVMVSGMVPAAADANAPRNSLASFGDTRTQTASVLSRIEASLKPIGLSLGDVVRMQVFLVGDPGKDGRMDFDGFMAAYPSISAPRRNRTSLLGPSCRWQDS